MGSRKQEATVLTPVIVDNTAEPPVRSIAVTRMFVIRQNTMKTQCTYGPYRAWMTSKKVWAFGALLFSSMARVAKRRIWTVAPVEFRNEHLRQSTLMH